MSITSIPVSYVGSDTLYSIIRSRDAATNLYVWDGSDLVVWDNADIADYGLAVTNAGGGLASSTIPSDLPRGNYRSLFFVRAGVSPATDDQRLSWEGEHDFLWDGTTVVIPPVVADSDIANAIPVSYVGAGTLYAIIRSRDTNTNLYVWDGVGLTPWVDGDIADYDVAVTSSGGDMSSFSVPSGLPEGNYRASFCIRAGGSPATTDQRLPWEGNHDFLWNGTNIVVPSATAEGYFADSDDVADAISATGLAIMSNMENIDDDPVVARIQRALDGTDAIINSRLQSMGYTIPFDLSSDNDAQILQEVSVEMVIAHLCRWRILQVADYSGNVKLALEKIGESHWKDAMDTLMQISTGYLQLNAECVRKGPQSNADALALDGQPLFPQGYGGIPVYCP